MHDKSSQPIPQPLGKGESKREAERTRDLRDFEKAVNSGHRNKAIQERLRK